MITSTGPGASKAAASPLSTRIAESPFFSAIRAAHEAMSVTSSA